MPDLPSNSAWPPAPWGQAFDRWRENEAWWTGDTAALSEFYLQAPDSRGRVTHRHRGVDHEGGLVGAVSSRFWGRPIPAGERRTKLHIPAAADIATLSSDLLFAEPPEIDYPDKREGVGDPQRARLAEIVASPQARATFAEGGELTSAFGASALTVQWDEETDDRVWIAPSGADVVIPKFRNGKLVGLTEFTEWRGVGNIVYRHLVQHDPGWIRHELWEGTPDNLGTLKPLQEQPETAPFAKIPGLTDRGVPTGINRLTAAWWVNAPARAWRRQGALAEAGRSDFAGVLALFDALDEAWSSWMRDLALGRGRLLVDAAYLDSNGPGQGASFDLDREVFQGLDIAGAPDKPFVQPAQFAIRVDEHANTTQALWRRILGAVGMGELDKETASATDRTATEITVGGQSKERTRDRKILYATQAVGEISRTAMLLDGVKFRGKGGGDFGPVEITFPPASQLDPEATSRIVGTLRAAKTLSQETAIRLQNPTWKRKDVADELERLAKENTIADPTSVGNPVTDPQAARDEARRLGLEQENGSGTAA